MMPNRRNCVAIGCCLPTVPIRIIIIIEILSSDVDVDCISGITMMHHYFQGGNTYSVEFDEPSVGWKAFFIEVFIYLFQILIVHITSAVALIGFAHT